MDFRNVQNLHRLGRGFAGLIDRPKATAVARRAILLSLGVNALGLVSPVFFTQVYDRVLATGNLATLAVLTLIALLAIALGATFEQQRFNAFAHLGAQIYLNLEQPVFRAAHMAALNGQTGRRSLAIDDLETVRSTLSGSLPGAVLDLLFAPFLILMLALLNPWLGIFALIAMVLMIGLTALTHWTIADATSRSQAATQATSNIAESHMRSAESAAAMGYIGVTLRLWAQSSRTAVSEQIRAAADAGGHLAATRAIRSGAQILIIAIAAHLALNGDMSAGAIIAASIILMKLIGPLDVILAAWRQVAHTKLAVERLDAILSAARSLKRARHARPRGRLSVDSLFAASPSGGPILRGVTFSVAPGEMLAVLGPTGAGKSTLLRCIMGVWPKTSGTVRLDGIPLGAADYDSVGKWLGFLPQNAELAPGTVRDNIARFTQCSHDEVVAAARAAGADQLIATFPDGYNADVGEVGATLSAGQRRRIALARALFGEPSLICLDEPEAHLDRDGELALVSSLDRAKARGAIVVIAAHKPAAVANADKILVLKDGRIAHFGPAKEVFPRISPTVQGAAS